MSKSGIICTLGPATRNIEVLKKLADVGMTVIRLNFSHGTYEQYKKDFALINTLNTKYKKNIKVLADLEGHRIRIGNIQDDQVALKEKQQLILTNDKIIGDNKRVSIDYSSPLTDIKKGTEIFIDDGNLKLIALSSTKNELIAEVQSDYILRSRKGVNIPDAKLNFPPMEEKDYQDMIFALKNDVDFVANSFVRNAQDMKPLQEILQKLKNTKCKLIAKIEDRSGIDNIDSILDSCDGIMVARGDMGISIPLWSVPIMQKCIIRKCKAKKKIAITATQMLESMVKNPIPTRAEVSDVANAIIDKSDFVMLSAETAIGKFPDKTVDIMRKIIEYTEENIYKLNPSK